jgi:hypothetical protein
VSKKATKTEFARMVSDGIVDQKPDLYNYVAKRVVEREEAERMGWNHYFDGKTVCLNGHVAPRYVSNNALCVDCKRLAAGKPAFYPKHEFSDDLTSPSVLMDPVASSNFDWTADKKSQFLNSWINTTSIPAALKVVRAQYTHLLDLLERNAEFQAEYEAAERKVSVVQQMQIEGEAAEGSDRVKLAMASNKFASFGAKTGLSGRPPVNAEEERAEFAHIIRTARTTFDQRRRLEAVVRASGPMADTPAPGPSTSAPTYSESALLGPAHRFGNVVPDTDDSESLSEADTSLCGGIEI